MIERASMTRKRRRRRPIRFSTAHLCLLFINLLLCNVPVSAKIRIPSPLASRESQKDSTSGISQAPDNASSDAEPNKIEQDFATANRMGRIYGIDLSSFSFATLSSQEYLSKIEARLQRLLKYYETAQSILSKGLELLWKTTNDVVRYKFPVGIVSAWSALIVIRKILKVPERRRRKKRQEKGEDLEEDRRDEEIPDTYRYVLRHSGRALDLDQDDLTSYRHLGGIEQVRARLLRSALSESNNPRVDRQNQEFSAEHQKEELLESLLSVLSMEFTPGGSHSEYIRSMIPAFAKVEEYAHKLDLLPTLTSSTSTRATTKPTPKNSTTADEATTQYSVFAGGEHEKRLLAMALQTAEVKILDSKLRSIRDRLIRTSYRLDRTVKYWKAKVESERSLMASASTGYGKRFALLSSSPIQRLKLQWSRLFHYASTSAEGGGSNSKNPNFVHNSLLEGDRLRLAFAEAAYKAEIIRLGKVLSILAKRPSEMPDSTLTSALVEQQQEQRKQKEKKLLDQVWETKDDNSSTEPVMVNKRPGPMVRIRNLASGTRNRIQRTLDRNKKPNASDPAQATKSNPLSILLKPLKRPIQNIVQRWEDYRRRPRYNWFLAIRFNADGRGKFSVQTYDEGSVAIESNVAKRILLRDYDAYQKPWLEASNEWALEARGLIVDTIRESVEASIHPNLGGGSMDNFQTKTKNGLTTIDREEAASNHLDDLEKTWRLRKYASETAMEDDIGDTESQPEEVATRQSKLLPALLSSKIISASPSIHSAPYRQWMFLYEMSRDINRLKRVGEGKSLKFKWKEVHWIHWLTQWNLVGLPSAALKIWAAMWVHEKSKPYVPKVTEISREAYAATLEILTTRFWTPFKDLVEELFSSKQGLVTGVSLAEEEESLDIMLKDLELGDGTPATRHEATLAATRQYESYMRSGLMLHALGGRLARLMLIQVQQLKVSMLDAAETIDYLFQSNKINMQLLAVIPAVGILFLGAKIFVRALFSVRAKDLRPITSVHADMTDYLNELESNIILGKGTSSGSESSSKGSSPPMLSSSLEAQQQQLGEFALTLYNYLLLLDYSSPQPFSSRHCDVIHQSLTSFLGKDGVFSSQGVTVDGQSKLLDNIQLKHQDLAKSL